MAIPPPPRVEKSIPPPPIVSKTTKFPLIPPPPPRVAKMPIPPPPSRHPKVDRFDGLREVFAFLREHENGATTEDAEKKLGYPCHAKITNLWLQGYVVDSGRKKRMSPVWIARAD